MATHKSKKERVTELKKYIEQSEYIENLEQNKICASFGLHYMKNLFREVYRKRFFDYLAIHTTTVATVSKETSIPEKFLTHCKAYYEKKGSLKVLFSDTCPTTGSSGVHFLSTNKDTWENPEKQRDSKQVRFF